MNDPTLTPEELNFIVNYAEECSEVIQESIRLLSYNIQLSMKTTRFGLDATENQIRQLLSRPPLGETADKPIRDRLAFEVGQLNCMITLLINNNILDKKLIHEGFDTKAEALANRNFKLLTVE